MVTAASLFSIAYYICITGGVIAALICLFGDRPEWAYICQLYRCYVASWWSQKARCELGRHDVDEEPPLRMHFVSQTCRHCGEEFYL